MKLKRIVSLSSCYLLFWLNLIQQQVAADAESTASVGCRFRNLGPFDEITFNIYADWGCYNYNREALFVGGRLKVVECSHGNEKVPGIMINDSCQVFTSENTDVLALVENSFQSDLTLARFLTCCDTALHCCHETLMNSSNTPGYCPAVWDGWSCYDATRFNTVEEQVCPIFAYSSGKPPRCNYYSSKQCFNNGTWNADTDYSTCSISSRMKARTRWHMAMLWISIIFCMPALFIFWKYGSLKLQKFYLIILLVLALILRNVLVILAKTIVIMDELSNSGETVMSKNEAGCKFLAVFEKLAANLVFTCILLLGIFLHQLLTNVFVVRKNSGPNMKWYYISGVVIAVLSATIWAIVMAVHDNQNCWMVIDETNFQWIFDAPRLLMLIINTVLMVHIIVTLWKTFRYRPNEQHVAIRTARSALYCAPIFASHFLFVMIRPNTDSCPWEQVYYFVVYFVEGLQGVLVVLLFFYMDHEVVRVVQLSYNRLAFAVNHRFSMHQNAMASSLSAVDYQNSAQARTFQAPDVILTSDADKFSCRRSKYEPDYPSTITKIEDWDANVTDTNVSLVSMDFGEDDDDCFYGNDETTVYDTNNVHEAICELAENVYHENIRKEKDMAKKPEVFIAKSDGGKLSDLHPKLFFKDPSADIVFVNDEEKL